MTLLSTSKEQLLDLKNKKIKRCLSLLLSSTSVLPAHTQYRHGIGISQMSPPVCMVVHSRSKSWGNLGWVAWWQMPANASARVWTTIHLKSSGQHAFFYQAALFWNNLLSSLQHSSSMALLKSALKTRRFPLDSACFAWARAVMWRWFCVFVLEVMGTLLNEAL